MAQTALIAGASRGLGLGLAREFRSRGWDVIGTVRGEAPALAETGAELLHLDVMEEDGGPRLAGKLAGRRVDVLFVNAGIANGPAETVPETSTEAFQRLMLTNVLGPLRVIEALAPLVPADGVVAAMSSGLGSVSNNTTGGWEIYRASKAGLNTLLRSWSARAGAGRTVLAVAPGWVRTDMGGPGASLDVETSCRGVVDTVLAWRGRAGAHYVNYQGKVVPW